ncbi:kinase-like protein [Calocera cornea HHB12733]|uniref:Kinase-like protein n=1 Tax=Calocera cornea HHB12733 TaxID=1353952 RepID=A0A165EI20_9BASI|nr:kinase-like protein [Calocera cornea HHB12733]
MPYFKDLLKELTLWMKLSHPCILELYGVCLHEPYGYAIVSPWMEHGHMMSYLQSAPEANRLSIVLDIAQGLSYLHSFKPPIVHGDLKGVYVLIRPSGQACLADFGLSRRLIATESNVSSGSSSACMPGNVRWMSPERIWPEKHGMTPAASFSPAGDIWSYGMAIFECFSGKVPYYEIDNPWYVCENIQRGQLPQHPGSQAQLCGLSGGLWNVIRECWQQDRRNRPPTTELLRKISTIVERNIVEADWVGRKSEDQEMHLYSGQHRPHRRITGWTLALLHFPQVIIARSRSRRAPAQ